MFIIQAAQDYWNEIDWSDVGSRAASVALGASETFRDVWKAGAKFGSRTITYLGDVDWSQHAKDTYTTIDQTLESAYRWISDIDWEPVNNAYDYTCDYVSNTNWTKVGDDLYTSATETPERVTDFVNDLNWENIGYATLAAGYLLLTTRYQIRNIWNGNKNDGTGPYSNPLKKAFQATLNAISALSILTLVNTFALGGYSLNGQNPDGGSNSSDFGFCQLTNSSNSTLGMNFEMPENLDEYGYGSQFILFTVASLCLFNQISNFISSNDKDKDKDKINAYGSVSKRLLQATVAGVTGLAIRKICHHHPEAAYYMAEQMGNGLLWGAQQIPTVLDQGLKAGSVLANGAYFVMSAVYNSFA